MTRINSSSGVGKPNNGKRNSEKKNHSEAIVQSSTNKRTHRNNGNQSTGEVLKLLGEATIKLPIVLVLGAGHLLKNYLLEYRELGVGVALVTRDAIEYTRAGISKVRARFTKPEKIDIPEVINPSNTNTAISENKTTSESSNSENKPETILKPTIQVNPKDKVRINGIRKPILRVSILEKNDKELIRQLIHTLNEIIPKSPNYKAEKVVVLLESLLMGVPFKDYIGIFNASYKNHLEQEELLEVAKNELTGIIGSCIHDNDLASKIVERISMPNLSLENQEPVPVLLKFPTRAFTIAEEFKNLPGINRFLSVEESLKEINLREVFLRDLMDVNPMPTKINLNAEYKNYLEFKALKDSRKYGFYLGRIDQILREGNDLSLKTFSIRKKLAQILTPSINEKQEIIDFISKVVEMANYGIIGSERLIDKVYENRQQSISGHAVEVKNLCNLFKGLEENRDIKSFKIEASKSISGYDVDGYLKIVDSSDKTDKEKVFFVEIKSSPDYAGNSSDQRNRLLENLPEGGKLVYIIDNVTEEFITQINHNEIMKLKELVKNENIEIWQSNGKNITPKISDYLRRNFAFAA